MTLAVTYEVVARHFFRAPTIWAFDVTYMLYGTHFMLGTAYTLMRIGHVRTDMLYQNWSIRRQNLIDAIGYLFFFFPAMALSSILAGRRPRTRGRSARPRMRVPGARLSTRLRPSSR